MKVLSICHVLLATIPNVYSQVSFSTITASATGPVSGDGVLPTGTNVSYLSYSTTRTLGSNSTNTAPDSSVTQLIGGLSNSTSTTRGGGTRTSSQAPVNTQPCNNHPEFCARKYSNITMVAAHNFAFAKSGNAASNQIFGAIEQLNDGIRMLQVQTHWENNTLWLCHTSCSLLNAGTLESQLTDIARWVDNHPYDVITILLGNSDFIPIDRFVDPILRSGLAEYAYVPNQIPMSLQAWPTLSEMILNRKRVVFFVDYKADQGKVPYILDEFSQIWETPFSPIDPTFPCTTERPPGLSKDSAKNIMYMANHNLNTPVSLFGSNILIPNTAQINQTNAVSGSGSLGLAAENCASDWGRPPNFLLVDYYNLGNGPTSSPGSVFFVAAQQNGVKYNRKCCGLSSSTSAALSLRTSSLLHRAMAWCWVIIISSFMF